MAEVAFVNYLGEAVALDPSRHARPKEARLETSKHNGWRVVGVPPGAQADAERAHKDAGSAKQWDAEVWLRKFKKKAVRTKPYEVRDAATVCADLAEKAGWTHLEICEIKKEYA